MTNITPNGELVLREISLESATIKSIKPCQKRIQYRAVINWLTKYKPHANASNLEQVKGYLEAFHHLYEVEDWERATTIIDITLNTPTNEKLRDILGTWGYYQQQKEIYEGLLGKLDNKWECIFLNGLGNCHFYAGSYQLAIDYFEQGLKIANKNYLEKNYRILQNLGSAYYGLGNYNQANSYLQQSLELAKKTGDRFTEAGILVNFGHLYDSLGKYNLARDYFQQALIISQETNNRSVEGAALGGLGSYYYSQQKYQEAITYHFQHLEIAEEIGDRQSIKSASGNIGGAYFSLKEYSAAITYLQKTLELTKQMGDLNGEETALLNLGLIEFELGNLTPAREYFEKALNIAREISDRRGEATILFNLSQCYYRCGKFQQGFTASHKYRKIMAESGVTVNALPLPRWYESFLKFSQRGRFKLTLFLLFVLIGFPFVTIAYSMQMLWWRFYTKFKLPE
ncbi:MAG: tetratricopeptide repeat protein [Okeania sp. SIO3B5]|uniref:tetratricopeptide repeat protein n=1 Tax=Okeania sp. SIO3B5 TaxID=2607811 RepID=UPI0013FF3927|nr:tetratricopeptide repeat protein [Okeania sp. SIO3B5]NEO51861.1 tetratricopeptide repeat protein [Okeania sp. SIO3B5]